jgi:vacuolar-type H+-ATPase subunit I/STV1
MFAGQEAVQLVLVFVALACVPLMLLGKPLAEHYGEGGRAQRAASGNGGGRRGAAGGDGGAIVAGDASPSLSPSPSPSPAAVGAAAAPSYSRVGQESDDEKAPLADEVDSAAAATRRRRGAQRRAQDEDTDSDFDELEEGSLSQALIYQAIHTIEFVLGAVSNTASYLRLWALSLAHAELAKVFWDKLIVSAVATGSPWLVAIGVSVWILATTSVLLLMDVLECFLHALRLHWVEFQNKFFYADGFPFEAFSFDAIDQAFFLD